MSVKQKRRAMKDHHRKNFGEYIREYCPGFYLCKLCNHRMHFTDYVAHQEECRTEAAEYMTMYNKWTSGGQSQSQSQSQDSWSVSNKEMETEMRSDRRSKAEIRQNIRLKVDNLVDSSIRPEDVYNSVFEKISNDENCAEILLNAKLVNVEPVQEILPYLSSQNKSIVISAILPNECSTLYQNKASKLLGVARPTIYNAHANRLNVIVNGSPTSSVRKGQLLKTSLHKMEKIITFYIENANVAPGLSGEIKFAVDKIEDKRMVLIYDEMNMEKITKTYLLGAKICYITVRRVLNQPIELLYREFVGKHEFVSLHTFKSCKPFFVVEHSKKWSQSVRFLKL